MSLYFYRSNKMYCVCGMANNFSTFFYLTVQQWVKMYVYGIYFTNYLKVYFQLGRPF